MWLLSLIGGLVSRHWVYLGIIAGVAGSLMYLKHTIYQQGYTTCQLENTKKELKREKNHAAMERKVSTLSDRDLDKRLSVWMRD